MAWHSQAAPGGRRIALVTAADSRYFAGLRRLLAPLFRAGATPPWQLRILDLGLAPAERQAVEALVPGAVFLEPDWMHPAAARPGLAPHRRVFPAKPHLPDLFPGFDAYVWIDADIWLQDPAVVGTYVEAAARTGLALVSEVDRSYRQRERFRTTTLLGRTVLRGYRGYLFDRLHEYYGRPAALSLGLRPNLNSGFFCMTAGAPHWRAWQASLAAARIERSAILCDQTWLLHAIAAGGLDAELLPATCNWIVPLAAPAFDPARGLYVEPNHPNAPIRAIHLTEGSGEEEFDVPLLGGGLSRQRVLPPAEISRSP